MRNNLAHACCRRHLAWISGLLFCTMLLAAARTCGETAHGPTSLVAGGQVGHSSISRREARRQEILAISHDIAERFHLTEKTAFAITREAYRAAMSNDVEPTLVLAVMAVESSYRSGAINKRSGAKGLMQVLPKWHEKKVRGVGGEHRLIMIGPNIRVGTAILAEYLDIENRRLMSALRRYCGSAVADTYVRRVQEQMRHLSRVAKSASPA